ncbi:phycobilisome rod-core linker polypeptide [Tolypothrix sp. FACHB-123]|uniref:phycobilisome rod-core linker polypeptide n=1 Tax=Tolypothrix sp. FACHB-123 TaxID=2692868 RepID=UPI0016899B3C|nr:phycobilisome rod-core linker polypeptide [Tolypothrix sp. FACHB-123]MBD2357127.1 phycobilisome rod-core linker polypeptide [Tolypothrix sp. FACHB-123]
MSIPLLEYAPSSQNQRVASFEIPGDEQPRIYTTDNLLSATEMDVLILAAYRQIFHEQQMLSCNRQIFLESQLKAGQITVKEFIRGLVLSDSFRRLNYDANNNYRFVELCVQRILGRRIYSDREKLAWSIVLATKGLVGFVQELVNSDEYLDNFGDNTVPYQRRRVLPQRSQGELPFERMARYGTDYRDKLPLVTVGYKPVQRLTLQTFLRSPNRDLVLLTLGSGASLILALSLLTLFGLFPQLFPY